MKKRVLGLVLSAVVVISLAACSGNKQAATASNEGTGNASPMVITVAASPTPHAEILYAAVDDMKALGYDLQVKEFSDYVLPNLAVDNNEVLANYFQHIPYLDDFNKERGTNVVSIGKIHFEPLAIYAGTKNELKPQAGDKVAVPNDVTNEARSLNLLEAAGIIKLKEGAGLTATKLDIVENPYEIEIVELEAAQIPRSLDSVAFACVNANYAIEAGLKVSDSLFVEDQESVAAKTYGNVLCVKKGNENEKWATDLLTCLKSQKIKDFINNRFDKAVLPID